MPGIAVWLGFVPVLLLAIGYAARHVPRRHRALMLGAFGSDLALVVGLEFGSQAVEKAAGAVAEPGGRGLLLFHIAVAIMVLGLYAVQLRLGGRLMRMTPGTSPAERARLRRRHIRVALALALGRLTVLATSFFVAGAVAPAAL